MSSPSTPRSTRSASNNGSPAILTPGKKIKAMLAAFDSDSDSDNAKSTTRASTSVPKLNLGLDSNGDAPQRKQTVDNNEDEDDDEDEVILKPKGRMAARMQAQEQAGSESASKGGDATAYERVARSLQEPAEAGADSQENVDASSDDDLPTARSRRGLRKAAHLSETDEPARSPSPARSFSPLFVSSPAKGQGESENEDAASDAEKDGKSQSNSRFLALVAQKRKEREEKERIEAEKKAARLEKMKQFSSDVLSGEDSDDGSGQRLTQKARPARKASKKALEEMNRETQRITRNMQLAHQARTKKKITKESFFARFNFMQPQGQDEPARAQDNSSTTAGSQNSSDVEMQKDKTTPPTSPVRASSPDKVQGAATAALQDRPQQEGREATNDEADLPSLEEILTQPHPPQEPTVVVQAVVQAQENKPEPTKKDAKPRRALTKPPVRVRISRQFVAEHQQDDSDDDLEVITSPAKSRRIAAFENLPSKHAQESSSMLKLKALAHLTSPTRRSTSMSPAELSAVLRVQARQQAAKERAERIEELRAKGIHIESAEERVAMDAEVEDLLEKARKEAEEIRKQERQKSNKTGNSNTIGIDSEEDEEYEVSDDDDGEGEDADEDEDEEDEEQEDEDLVENEAGEADESEESGGENMEDDASDVDMEPAVSTRRKRPLRVVSDDEDEEQEPETPARTVTQRPESVKKPTFPDMPNSGSFTMGLSQAFAATLGGSQSESQPESSAVLGSLPDPARPPAELHEADSQVLVKDSQERRESVDILQGFTQSETRISESPGPKMFSQYSQIPDPTQDEGFVMSPFDQAKRFVEPPVSTVETVLLPRDESPVAKKSRTLRRGHRAETADSDENGFEIEASAFDIMRKAAKEKKEKKEAVLFDKNNSKAKEIVDEAAEESEDEYAGLGGASDDEDAGDEDEYDREMINDNSGEVVDEKELAALNANHQRAMDEKEVSKLLKDITTGALRRRRAADDEFDLDDSDDELMARRRAKQREFAKMRKALLADEKIGEIAENPKKAAFFKAIEDRDQDDDMDLDFLDAHPDSQENDSSQDVQAETVHDDSATIGNKRKRPLEPSAADIANRPPPHLRRTPAAVSRKPSTLAEIRETVSFLTETPEYDSFHEDASIEEEDEHETSEEVDDSTADEETGRTSQDGFAIPRNPRRTRGPVVDRLSLLRQASSNSASSANGKLAFQSTSTADSISRIGFQPPAFLRRSTTGSSSSSTSSVSSGSNSTRTKTGPVPAAAHGKKGAVNYYTAAREREREKELRMKQKGSGSSINALLSKHAGGSLGSIVGKGQWE
ncbi:hypothetical protein NFIA_034280 [Paecilomyces variotii No. 5]|uniref:DNA replication checkpoint mediator MRC1 domain-containing protein n=1 Tax=Byssochlamys spectabilis (strain No. 5 / NBRC 109023) TaxID=1356009 RepID=V5FLI3_BYSSN|nr:hypothetical protein NFIA_034280 [Paecilomyces variotii No. 5]